MSVCVVCVSACSGYGAFFSALRKWSGGRVLGRSAVLDPWGQANSKQARHESQRLFLWGKRAREKTCGFR